MIDNPDLKITGGSETILIVEDEELIVRVLKRALESLGYTIIVATNGNEAVSIAETSECRIDLSLLDLGIPGRSSGEVLSVFQDVRPGMKVILCSGSELTEDTKTMLKASAKAFLKKPFRLNTISSVIREVIEKKV